MNRLILTVIVALPIAWFGLAYLSVVSWPQLDIQALSMATPQSSGLKSGMNNSVVIWLPLALSVCLAFAVRWWVSQAARLGGLENAFWSTSLYLLAIGSLISAILAGFWTLDSQSLSAMGSTLSVGGNPFVPNLSDPNGLGDNGGSSLTELTGPLVALVSAAVFHWSGLGANWANGLWAGSIALATALGTLLAMWGLFGRHIGQARGLLFAANPLLILWGASTLDPVLLATPCVVVAMIASARGWGTICGLCMGLAIGVHPLLAPIGLILLLPGPTLWHDRGMSMAATFRGGAVLLTVSLVLYAPLWSAWTQSAEALSSWGQVKGASGFAAAAFHLGVAQDNLGTSGLLESVGRWFNAPLFQLLASFIIAVIFGVLALMAQSIRPKANSTTAAIDHRARACIFAMLCIIALMPNVPAVAPLLIVPMLARVPNLAASFAVTGLGLYFVGEPFLFTSASPGEWPTLVQPALPFVGLFIGWMAEFALSRSRRKASTPPHLHV